MWNKKHVIYKKGCDDMEDIILAKFFFFYDL